MQLTLYRIEELRSSRIWNAAYHADPSLGSFMNSDDDVVVFDDYEEAEAFAEKVGGIVEVHRRGTFGHSLGYAFAAAAE